MYEHDTVLNNERGQPIVSFGPRKRIGDKDIGPCPPIEAEFWGVYLHFKYDVEVQHLLDTSTMGAAQEVANAVVQTHKNINDSAALFYASTARLPDGSGFSVGKFPLPKDHWLYVPDSQSFEPNAMLTEGQRAHFEMRAREAIRRSTMSGKDMDFDPDALVQNLSVLVCGEYPLRAKAELTPQHQGYSEADMGDQPDRYK